MLEGYNKLDISGVVICTPASTHFQIAKKFIKKELIYLLKNRFALNLQRFLNCKNFQPKKKYLLCQVMYIIITFI